MKLIVNWLIILTAPVWFIPTFVVISVFVILNPAFDPKMHDAITGKTWIVCRR